MMHRILLVALLVGQVSPAATTMDGYAVHQVSPRITVFERLGAGRANSVLVHGEDGALLVDAQIAPSAGEALVDAVRRVTDVPIRHLVLTHWHVDHAHGAAGVRARVPAVEILAHAASVAAMAADGPAQLVRARPFWAAQVEQAAARVAAGDAAIDPTVRALAGDAPVVAEMATPAFVKAEAVTSERSIDLGGIAVHLIPAAAHTEGDLLVYVPAERVLIGGDVILPGRDTPEATGQRASALARVRTLAFDVLVPGHGRPVARRQAGVGGG